MSQKVKVNEIIEILAQDVLTELKSGTLKRWTTSWLDSGFPTNAMTQNKYSLWNSRILSSACETYGFKNPVWATFNQWKSLNCKIKKGEKAVTRIISPISKNENNEIDDPLETPSSIEFQAKAVFNIDQTDAELKNFQKLIGPIPLKQSKKLISFIQSISHKMKEDTIEKEAYYVTGGKDKDTIFMPPFNTFKSEEDYWATYLHELGHWTGAETRLNRNMKGKKWGDEIYAFEELVAELCSTLLATAFGFQRDLQHKEYLGSWLRKLDQTPQTIYLAGKKANEAASFLCNLAGKSAPKSWPLPTKVAQ